MYAYYRSQEIINACDTFYTEVKKSTMLVKKSKPFTEITTLAIKSLFQMSQKVNVHASYFTFINNKQNNLQYINPVCLHIGKSKLSKSTLTISLLKTPRYQNQIFKNYTSLDRSKFKNLTNNTRKLLKTNKDKKKITLLLFTKLLLQLLYYI